MLRRAKKKACPEPLSRIKLSLSVRCSRRLSLSQPAPCPPPPSSLSDRFATRARADDPDAGFGREWKLSPACSLSPIHTRKLSVLGTRQHHSLWALLSGNYEDRDLFRFTLTCGDAAAALAFDDPGEAGAWHAAFTQALAALGGGAGNDSGRQQQQQQHHHHQPQQQQRLEGTSEDDGEAAAPPPAADGGAATPRHAPRPATPGWRAPGGVRRAAATAAAGVARRVGYASGGGSHGGAGDGPLELGEGGGPPALPAAAGSAALAPLERSASAAALARDFGRTLDACLARAAAAAAVANADGRDAAGAAAVAAAASLSSSTLHSYPLPLPARSASATPGGGATGPCLPSPLGLAPWYTEDGVTAYCGRDADGDDVLVESFVVRAPPRLCVATLLKGETEGGATAFGGPQAEPPALLAVLDAHTQYLRLRWRPSGWLGGALVCPRELTLKRAWRREDDGQYVVLYTSVEPGEAEAAAAETGRGGGEAAPPPPWPGLFGGGAPVRGRVLSSGYTFAPLLPEYDPTRASGETLVTHVAKLDAGGVVGALRRSWFAPLRAVAGPAWGALLHPLAQRSVLLKHRAEAERFVARPFLAGARSAWTGTRQAPVSAAAAATPAPEAARVAALATSRSIFRRSTAGAGAGAGPGEAPASSSAAPTPQPPAAPRWGGTMPPSMWSSPGAAGFKVRGPAYLTDHRKVEAGDTVFALASVDLVELDAPTFNVARFLPSIRDSPSPFTFVVNLMIPGARPYSVAIAWAADRAFGAPPTPPRAGAGGEVQEGGPLARFESGTVPPATTTAAAPPHPPPDDEADGTHSRPSSPFDLALARFLAGGDSPQANAVRDGAFKLIPRVVDGPWVVRQSVGSTPCLLGHKLRQRYWRGPGYLEVDIDVASSSVAATVVGLVMGATKAVVVDLAIVLQGNAADELPEALLGTVRLARVDMLAARYLDTKSGVLYEAGVRPGGGA